MSVTLSPNSFKVCRPHYLKPTSSSIPYTPHTQTLKTLNLIIYILNNETPKP